jgi:hypothetical protein
VPPSLVGRDNGGRPHFRAGHGDPLGHHSDRPDQANRDHHGDSDPCAHLHPFRRVDAWRNGAHIFFGAAVRQFTVDRKLRTRALPNERSLGSALDGVSDACPPRRGPVPFHYCCRNSAQGGQRLTVDGRLKPGQNVSNGPVQFMLNQLQIRVLGELKVARDGKALPLPASKKTRALLGYLAVVGRPVRRDHLCEMFWKVPDEPTGLASLEFAQDPKDHQR